MNHYEVTFIIDPVLSGDEIKSTASTYETLLKDQGCTIVHVNELGLKQLAYPINKKSSGVYYCMEFSAPNGAAIGKTELSLRRDERIMRFLTIKLDKYGVKYNEDRRNGVISAYKKKESKKKSFDGAPVTGPAVAAAPEVVKEEPKVVPVEVIAPVVAEVVAPIVSSEEE
jgi:small subunit ribosomal protein S6